MKKNRAKKYLFSNLLLFSAINIQYQLFLLFFVKDLVFKDKIRKTED